MTVKKKPQAPKKKTAGKRTPAKKKSGEKKAAPSAKPAAKTTRSSKASPAKRKPAVKKTAAKKASPKKVAVKKPVARKPVATKPVRKTKKAKGGKESNRLEELRKYLIKRREAIVKEAKEEIAKYISGENRQLVDTALDDGDWAVVDISEDINLMRLGAHRKALHDIDESLRKIKEGTYGICEECGEEISGKRLQVMPTASLCISCQENKEQFEALEKIETP
jgi:DnaK suppressor protein